MIKKLLKFFFIVGGIVFLLGTAAGLTVGLYAYHRFTRDLPKIERLGDYTPKAVTGILAEDGTLIGEVYDDERRYPVEFSEIPLIVRNAFLAAEDANFYTHPGIDFVSILRAIYVNLQHKETMQGASTITQQVVKSLLLTKEKTYERKIKEAILSYRLEQRLTKDEIFSIYLNEIFLGATAYGVRAASKIYFHKELKDLNLAEAAFLAGLPPKPSYLSDPNNRNEAIWRQRYVLDQMVKNNMISSEVREQALNTPLEIFPPDKRKIFDLPYYTSHVVKVLEAKLGEVYGATKANHMMRIGGFEVHTAADVHAGHIAQRAVRRGLQEVDKRRGWRGPLSRVQKGEVSDLLDAELSGSTIELEPNKVYRALVKDISGGVVKVLVGEYEGTLDLKESAWAEKLLDQHDNSTHINLVSYLRPGHIIEVSLIEQDEERKGDPAGKERHSDFKFRIDQTPDIEGAFVLTNALTGSVSAIVGGYDYSRSQFNRATQGLRQPGSAFKPFIYLSSIEKLNYTPATIVPDSPISLQAGNGEIWSPDNFDHKFLGPITFRTALQRSRNVVSVFLVTRVGVDKVIEVARRLGLTTPIPREYSISLGTPDVYLIELVRAYGAFAAGGWLADERIITTIKDRNGKVVYDQRPKQKQVLKEEDAFLMANVMKGVVERGTATIIKQLNRPVAGKTGTTNDQMDAWFIGYTPEWSAGAWVGFDQKKKIGRLETGGKAAAPIFLYFMQEFLADEPPLDFDPPDGVIPVPINLSSGRPVDPGDPDAFIEYFKIGTEARWEGEDASIPQDYLSSEEF